MIYQLACCICHSVFHFEFARRPRSLDEILRWKVTEFREFLLYSGAVVLRHILHEALYSHFMLLFVGMRMVVSRQLSLQCCDYAHELLEKFVTPPHYRHQYIQKTTQECTF